MSLAEPPVEPAGPELPLHALLGDAERQLEICNACRYCAGLCAVFPALGRRRLLGEGDVTQLANLCHDCRACYDACMYSPPHEFAIDLPKVLSAVRVADYDRLVWPQRPPRLLAGWAGVATIMLGSILLVLALAVLNAGWSGLTHADGDARSSYELIPHWALLALFMGATVFALGVMADAGRRYWRELGPPAAGGGLRATALAVWEALTLRYLRGAGEECFYPADDEPSSVRRRLHGLLAGGFLLCLAATASSAFAENILGSHPPHPFLSMPVISGLLGGTGMVIGAAGLLILKPRQSEVASYQGMTVKDYGLLAALLLLAVTGLATLFTRATSAFGIIVLVHLAAVLQAYVMAPYSKFVHIVFRFLALVRDNQERISG